MKRILYRTRIFNGTLLLVLFCLACVNIEQGAGKGLESRTGPLNPLPVVFKSQGPPGDRGKSKNCGQTSALMAMCYHRGTIPSVEGIKAIDDWLFSRFRDPVNNYNGTGTTTRKLEELVRVYGGFPLSYKAERWKLQEIRDQIDRGLPVVALVQARYLSNRGYKYAWEHFVLVVGYTKKGIICHDPARPDGAGKRYSNEDFEKAFSFLGGEVVVVVPDHGRPEGGESGAKNTMLENEEG